MRRCGAWAARRWICSAVQLIFLWRRGVSLSDLWKLTAKADAGGLFWEEVSTPTVWPSRRARGARALLWRRRRVEPELYPSLRPAPRRAVPSLSTAHPLRSGRHAAQLLRGEFLGTRRSARSPPRRWAPFELSFTLPPSPHAPAGCRHGDHGDTRREQIPAWEEDRLRIVWRHLPGNAHLHGGGGGYKARVDQEQAPAAAVRVQALQDPRRRRGHPHRALLHGRG